MTTKDKIIALIIERGPLVFDELWVAIPVKSGTLTTAISDLIDELRICEVTKGDQIAVTLGNDLQK